MVRTAAILVVLLIGLAGGTALALDLGEAVVKTVGVGVVVNAIADPADKAINTLTANKNLPEGASTKVVPILSLGEKGYVGAVQVAGSQELVNKTKAVAQLETSWSNKQYRIKLLMPMDSVNPIGTNRVRGLGVSALVDVALSSNAYLLPRSRGWNAGDVLKGAAIGYAVKSYGPQLDTFINSVFKNQSGTPAGATKVVPYLSFGEKAYIGMMQVAGPKAQVDKVQAVWQYEDLFDSGRVRLRVLVPSDSLNPLQLRRVKGVGCTAVIDAMLLRAREYEKHPDDYRYFERSAVFVGPGEDPHYRPPGWDRGRKTGWAKHGDPNLPPGQSKQQGSDDVVIVLDDNDNGNGEQHRHQHQEQKGKGKGKGKH
ncbi:MAG: hypothetical protein JXA57_06475 [Armatimonadetes bacterium]|nr:hypothetical protein [Armatimonadota bacterium]